MIGIEARTKIRLFGVIRREALKGTLSKARQRHDSDKLPGSSLLRLLRQWLLPQSTDTSRPIRHKKESLQDYVPQRFLFIVKPLSDDVARSSARRERLFLLNYHRYLFGLKVLFISVYMGVFLKVGYHRISLAISLFGCIFGCVNYTPESYEYQAQYHLCSGEP